MKSSVSSKKGRSPRYGWLVAPLCLLFALLTASALAQEFSVVDVSVAEDTGTAQFTVTLTGASGSYSYAVDFLAADGTATTADGDYTR